MTDVLTRRYFHWLVSQIEIGFEDQTYYDLFHLLHEKEFVWIVPNDDNRVADALDLRKEFYTRGRNGYLTPQDAASVLEVIVALSRRLEFEAGGQACLWAGRLLENLGLDKMCDPLSERKREKVKDIVEALVFRTYERNGTGGFFPLRHSDDDQTQIEIWYQMSAYIGEHDLI